MKSSFPNAFAYCIIQYHHFLGSQLSRTQYFHFHIENHLLTLSLVATRCIFLSYCIAYNVRNFLNYASQSAYKKLLDLYKRDNSSGTYMSLSVCPDIDGHISIENAFFLKNHNIKFVYDISFIYTHSTWLRILGIDFDLYLPYRARWGSFFGIALGLYDFLSLLWSIHVKSMLSWSATLYVSYIFPRTLSSSIRNSALSLFDFMSKNLLL